MGCPADTATTRAASCPGCVSVPQTALSASDLSSIGQVASFLQVRQMDPRRDFTTVWDLVFIIGPGAMYRLETHLAWQNHLALSLISAPLCMIFECPPGGMTCYVTGRLRI